MPCSKAWRRERDNEEKGGCGGLSVKSTKSREVRQSCRRNAWGGGHCCRPKQEGRKIYFENSAMNRSLLWESALSVGGRVWGETDRHGGVFLLLKFKWISRHAVWLSLFRLNWGSRDKRGNIIIPSLSLSLPNSHYINTLREHISTMACATAAKASLPCRCTPVPDERTHSHTQVGCRTMEKYLPFTVSLQNIWKLYSAGWTDCSSTQLSKTISRPNVKVTLIMLR